MSQCSQAYQHIASHLELFGFGNDLNGSVLQCCKELLDNAFEACRGQPRPLITLELEVSAPGVCLIEVTDNGVGFKDLNFTEAVTCFSSAREVDTSVDAEQNVKFGRYGCGLSASLVYSARSTGGEMRVTSKQKASPLMRIANVKFDTCSGQAIVVSEAAVPVEGFESGTKIGLYLPVAAVGEALVAALEELLLRYVLLPGGPGASTSFALSVASPAASVSLAHHPQAPYRGLPSSTAARRCGVVQLQRILAEGGSHVSAETQSDGPNAFHVQIHAVLVPQQSTAGTPTATATATTAPAGFVQMLRYVNSTPLLDYLDEGAGCLLARAIRAVKWARYGYRLTSPHASTRLLSCPQWDLSPSSEAVPQVDSITFVVDISGSEVPFTSLRKTAIAECQPLGKIATAAFEKALSELQAANPHALKTKEDLQREEKRETIAYASRAIAKLVAFAETSAEQETYLGLLSLPPNSVNAATIADMVSRVYWDHEESSR